MQAKFPEAGKKIRKVSGDTAEKVKALVYEHQIALSNLRKAALQVAALECELKEIINFNAGVEVPGLGILYWTADGRRRKVKRVNWMRLAKDMKISAAKLKKYAEEETPKRAFFLHAHAHTPEGVVNLAAKHPSAAEIDLEADV